MRPNTRVELSPHLDLWMRGARFGTVVKITRTRVHVHVDRIDRVVKFHPDNVTEID